MKNDDFSADYYRMTGNKFTFWGGIKTYFFSHNIRFMYWWRKRNMSSKNPIAKIMCYRLSKKYGLEIGNCKIGSGLYLGHPYNITVNQNAVIGRNVNLHKGVTIGNINVGKRRGCPVIGDNVWIGINSTVVGGIIIGNDVVIAPNAFVNFDVPDHSVVVGNPGVIHHKENAAFGYIEFTDYVRKNDDDT